MNFPKAWISKQKLNFKFNEFSHFDHKLFPWTPCQTFSHPRQNRWLWKQFSPSASSKLFISQFHKFPLRFFHSNFPHQQRKNNHHLESTKSLIFPSPYIFKHIWIKLFKAHSFLLRFSFCSLLPSWKTLCNNKSIEANSTFLFYFFHQKLHEENFILISPTSNEQAKWTNGSGDKKFTLLCEDNKDDIEECLER
jgi:hypothetical protein